MLKKITASVTAFLMLFGAGAFWAESSMPETAIFASAEEEVSTCGDYDYTALDDGTVKILGYHGVGDKAELPSEIEGKSVSGVEEGLFASHTELTSVKLPDGLTAIEYRMFAGCTSLTDVNIPEGVTSIGTYSFEECESLASVTLPEGVESIGRNAFRNCSAMTSITIPASVNEIDQEAFGYIFYYDEMLHVYVSGKVEGFKIRCFEGTAGERYAIDNGFDYELLKPDDTQPEPEYILGDVNGDGKVDIADVSKLMNHINGVKSLDENETLRADTDGSKTVDVSDAAMIVNHINGVKSLY